MATAAANSKPLTKNQILDCVAANAGLTRKAVSAVLNGFRGVLADELRRCGACKVLDLVKVQKVVKPAVRGGVTKPNPFKPGETLVTKDQPARTVVRVRPLKALKDQVA